MEDAKLCRLYSSWVKTDNIDVTVACDAGKHASFLRVIRSRSLAAEYDPSTARVSLLGIYMYLGFSSDADNVRLTNVFIIIII